MGSNHPFGHLKVMIKRKAGLDVASMERCRVYYKGEGGGFPQVWAVVSFVNPSCPCLILAPKVFQLCINHLVLILCRSMWVIETCQFFLVSSQSSITPLYPSKVLRTRERTPTSYSSAVFNLDSHLNPSGVGSASFFMWQFSIGFSHSFSNWIKFETKYDI
jgi:hypothetical protein